MSVPTLAPISSTPTNILPSIGVASDVNSGVSFGIYSNTLSPLYSAEFVTGAVEQVTYVYHKLGGDVLDIELNSSNVYSSFEEATLEYSYIMNLHQAKNALPGLLGASTGSFDHDGNITGSLAGEHIELKYPKMQFAYAKRASEYVSFMSNVGGTIPIYSASFDVQENVQDYDLQAIISSSSDLTASLGFYQKVKNNRILVRKVFFVTPAATWRFFGIYGGLNVMGNLNNYNLYSYGQYSDQTTYEIVPCWENKSQAMAYKDAINTRCSHWSFELVNNKLRLFPIPTSVGNMTPSKFWIQFSIEDPENAWKDDDVIKSGVDGVNNMNSLPFENIPFANINSIGKNFIRKYSLAICKEMLANIRGKFQSLPIPNGTVNLNAESLLAQAKEEKEILKKELMDTLNELTYSKISELEASMAENVNRTLSSFPNLIFVG